MEEQNPHERNDLLRFIASTVENMRDRIGTIEDRMVTRDEFHAGLSAIRSQMATKEAMEAGFAAVRGDIERVALRLDQVDRSQTLHTTAVEHQVKRIHSVVYLLVKDQPDLVRMLGSES